MVDWLDCFLVGSIGGLVTALLCLSRAYRMGYKHGRAHGRMDMRDMVSRSYFKEEKASDRHDEPPGL